MTCASGCSSVIHSGKIKKGKIYDVSLHLSIRML